MKQIKGYEDYCIDEMGKVFSKRRNKYLSPGLLVNGYEFVHFSVNKKVKNFLVHRLVAQSFLDNPFNKSTVNHKDGNKRNNHVSNLEWATNAENNKHAFDNLGRQGSMKGKIWSDHPNSRKVICLKNNKAYNSISEASESLNLFSSSISLVCSGKYKKTKGFKFQYLNN